MPGQLFDHVVGFGDPLTSPGVGLAGRDVARCRSAASAEGVSMYVHVRVYTCIRDIMKSSHQGFCDGMMCRLENCRRRSQRGSERGAPQKWPLLRVIGVPPPIQYNTVAATPKDEIQKTNCPRGQKLVRTEDEDELAPRLRVS